MRVLFATQPLYGHFHPLVPYARALEGAGHEVAFIADGGFRGFQSVVEASGFRCFPGGQYRTLPEIVAEIRQEHPDATEDQQAGLRFRKLFLDRSALTLARDLLTLTDSWRPDVIVRDPREIGAFVVAEHLGIPHATAGAPFLWSLERWIATTAEPLAWLEQELGLGSVVDPSALFRYLDLLTLPPTLLLASDHLHPVTHYIRPVSFDRSDDETLPGWLDDLPTRPTVYGTLGTTNWSRVPGAFEALAQGVAEQPYNAILTVGMERDPLEVDPRAGNVRVERYVPQSLLLPRCDAVVCHGGFSSTLAALMHGLPLVVMPLGADQFDNAARAEHAGAAVAINPHERTADRVREAVRTVLADPDIRANAQRVRDDIESLPDLEHAVELLVQLERASAPIPRTGRAWSGKNPAKSVAPR